MPHPSSRPQPAAQDPAAPDPVANAPGRPAHIVGVVESRQGDGVNIRIRKGPCTVHLTALDATLDWRDGDFSGRVAMPLSDFELHLRSGAVVYDDAGAA